MITFTAVVKRIMPYSETKRALGVGLAEELGFKLRASTLLFNKVVVVEEYHALMMITSRIQGANVCDIDLTPHLFLSTQDGSTWFMR